MQEILKQGLYQNQLEQLIQLCEVNFDRDPVTFFVLKSIFEKILYDFWEIGQVPKKEYDLLEEKLVPVLLEAWESAGDPKKTALEKLIRTYKRLINPS
jgi:hypothetical protein